MRFQSFQQTWKPLQPSAPVLQPKHFAAFPSQPSNPMKPLVPAVNKEQVADAKVLQTASTEEHRIESSEAGMEERVVTTVSNTCERRAWFASPWLSLGLAIALGVVMMWALSVKMDHAWLMKQHTQLMFNLLETLRS